jgi:hypothetical protein
MPVTWTDYDNFRWSEARQAPMSQLERDSLAECAADLLQLAAADRERVWGAASPPGRYAASVIRVNPNVHHRFVDAAAQRNFAEIGLKIFKTTSDGMREAARSVEFHAALLAKMPGLPNAHIQGSIAGGYAASREGKRGYIVQQWAQGATLDTMVRAHASMEVPGWRQIRSIVVQLLGSIIIPTWAVGLIWWDIRAANYCYSADADHLMLIDVDALGAYAAEIIDASASWTRREKGRQVALARLRQMVVTLLAVRIANRSSLLSVWDNVLDPVLRTLGRQPAGEAKAHQALRCFADHIDRAIVHYPRTGSVLL